MAWRKARQQQVGYTLADLYEARTRTKQRIREEAAAQLRVIHAARIARVAAAARA